MTFPVVPEPDMIGDTQTLSFPPWLFQQVLHQSKCSMSGSVSDRAKVRAPWGGILKAKNPHSSQQEEGACDRARLQQHQDFNKLWGLHLQSLNLPPIIEPSSTRVPTQKRCHGCHRTPQPRDGHHSQPPAFGPSGLLLPGLAAHSDASKKPAGTSSTGTFITFRQSMTARPSPIVTQIHSASVYPKWVKNIHFLASPSLQMVLPHGCHHRPRAPTPGAQSLPFPAPAPHHSHLSPAPSTEHSSCGAGWSQRLPVQN